MALRQLVEAASILYVGSTTPVGLIFRPMFFLVILFTPKTCSIRCKFLTSGACLHGGPGSPESGKKHAAYRL
jgi:hypothetical protein